MRRLIVVVSAFVLGALVFGVIIANQLPSQDEALIASGQTARVSDQYYTWMCPTENGTKQCSLVMEIPYADYESSMKADVCRISTVFTPAPYSFVKSDDPYVQMVADHIDSETDGLSEIQKATAALWFVQCCITYSSDSELFGTDDFWAFPLETLALHKGDCEDTSVLLASILGAMGFDSVLIDFPGHMAVGVAVDGGTGTSFEEYYYCETTRSTPSFIGTFAPSILPDDIWHCRSDDPVRGFLNSFVSGYGRLIHDIFPL